jgi:hypothetical protein
VTAEEGAKAMPTLRRLNDRERYYGLTFPGWIGVALAGALLYVAIQVSPFGTRATITIVVLVLAFAGVVIAAVSGQALSPARHLAAIVRYHRAAKRLELAPRPDNRGLVLDSAPQLEVVDEVVVDPLLDLTEGLL